jgi:hypothetical protein
MIAENHAELAFEEAATQVAEGDLSRGLPALRAAQARARRRRVAGGVRAVADRPGLAPPMMRRRRRNNSRGFATSSVPPLGRRGRGVSASLATSVRRAVIWRSGSQIAAQLVAWGSTLAVVRILDPADYGLFAMTQVVLAFLSFLNGYGFASSLIQEREIDRARSARLSACCCWSTARSR